MYEDAELEEYSWKKKLAPRLGVTPQKISHRLKSLAMSPKEVNWVQS